MVVLMSKNNSVKIGTCSRYLSKNTELDIIVQWFQIECVPWHLQLEYRDAAGPWSRRGSGRATGCSGCGISPRRLGAPHCQTGHQPKPPALPLAGQFSRQVGDATLVSLPATAMQSTPCHDGRCRRVAIGDSPHPVGVRHWQMHLADSKEGRRVHGHVPGALLSPESLQTHLGWGKKARRDKGWQGHGQPAWLPFSTQRPWGQPPPPPSPAKGLPKPHRCLVPPCLCFGCSSFLRSCSRPARNHQLQNEMCAGDWTRAS